MGETPGAWAAVPSFFRRRESYPPILGKEGCAMVSYTELFQFCILLTSVIGLVYKICKDKKKKPPLLTQ